MDPRFRLRRRYPGERFSEPSRLEVRLVERDKPLKPPRVILGEGLSVPEVKVRDNRVKGRPFPNAPLLKRLVLFPYRQDPGYPRRAQWRDPVPWDLLQKTEVESVPSMIAARPAAVQGSVVRSAMERILPRERLSADAWLAGRRR